MMKSRIWGPVLALALVMGAFPLQAHATHKRGKAHACPIEGQVVERGNGWSSISMPDLFRLWPHPGDPSVMFAVQGRGTQGEFVGGLMRTTDSGCTWTEVATPDTGSVVVPIPDNPTGRDLTTYIRPVYEIELAMSPDPKGLRHVYMALTVTENKATSVQTANPAPINRTLVYRSTDLGDSWEKFDQGLSPQGQLEQLQVAPSDADTVYIGMLEGVEVLEWTLHSRIGSSTLWEKRANENSGAMGCRVNLPGVVCLRPGMGSTPSFVVDPFDPQGLWVWSERDPLLHSADGGRTWDTPAGAAQPMTVDVIHSPGRPASVLVNIQKGADGVDCCASYALRTQDAGQTFQPLYVMPEVVDGDQLAQDQRHHFRTVMFGPTPDKFIMKAVDDAGIYLYRFDPRARRWVAFGALDGGPIVVHYPDGQTHIFGSMSGSSAAPGTGMSIERYSGRL